MMIQEAVGYCVEELQEALDVVRAILLPHRAVRRTDGPYQGLQRFPGRKHLGVI
jgi:hypothetical protein